MAFRLSCFGLGRPSKQTQAHSGPTHAAATTASRRRTAPAARPGQRGQTGTPNGPFRTARPVVLQSETGRFANSLRLKHLSLEYFRETNTPGNESPQKRPKAEKTPHGEPSGDCPPVDFVSAELAQAAPQQCVALLATLRVVVDDAACLVARHLHELPVAGYVGNL